MHVRLGENANEVLSEVISKVNEARGDLPREIEDPVVTNSAGGEGLIWIAFLSDQLSLAQITDYLVRNIQPELATWRGSGLPGSRATSLLPCVYGWTPIRWRPWASPPRTWARLSAPRTISLPRETTKGNLVRAAVDAQTDLQDTGGICRYRGAAGGRICGCCWAMLLEIELAEQNSDSAEFSSGEETVFLSINVSPGSNPLEVARRVKEVLPPTHRANARRPELHTRL